MGRAPDGDLLSCRFEQIVNTPMDIVSAEATQSWFVAKVAVALSPVVILTTARDRLVDAHASAAHGESASIGTVTGT